MTVHNVVSVSGGKDSTAMLAVAVAQEAPSLQAVFADTGHEHPLTYEYVDYLSNWLTSRGLPAIRRVRADFTADMARRREYLLGVAAGEYADKFGRRRHTRESAAQAAELMQPTGNPFLDLCILKGRFPSTRVRFCSEELKRNVIAEQVFLPMMDGNSLILSWQGVRHDESAARAGLPECDEVGGGLFNYRPIRRWTVADVFEAHRYMGLRPNPLYQMGMGRVGCMPCIHSRKDEIREIANRFPAEIERVAKWEQEVAAVSKCRAATFFPTADDHGTGIHAVVQWSRTSNGKSNFDLFRQRELADNKCSSIYGLCDTGEA